MNIFNKLEQLVDLTDNEKILVCYMKEHTNDFIRLSAKDISKLIFSH